MLLAFGGLGDLVPATIKNFIRSKTMKRILGGLALLIVFLGLAFALTGCSEGDGKGLFGFLNSTGGAQKIASVAAVAGEISAYLTSDEAKAKTNAELLLAVSAFVPSKYTVYFSAVLSALKDAAAADAAADAGTTTEKALRAPVAPAAVDPALINKLQQDLEKIKKQNSGMFSFRPGSGGDAARLALVAPASRAPRAGAALPVVRLDREFAGASHPAASHLPAARARPWQFNHALRRRFV
jgi:hypothetical protein